MWHIVRTMWIIRTTAVLIVLLIATRAPARVLESPTHGATLSGIGFISGWKCNAENITVTLNGGGHIPLAMGQPRADTRLACGTLDNGFVTQVNWALLGDGEHTAVAYDGGVEFARSTFSVVTMGEEFVKGAMAQCYVPNFPAPGENVLLEWEESTQHFELVRVDSQGQVSCEGWNISRLIDEETITFANGTAEWVQQCLAAGVDPNARDENDFTPLHHAMKYLSADAVRILLRAGAMVNARDRNDRTPLHHAAVTQDNSSSVEHVRLLLDTGARIHVQDSDGWTPLHLAAWNVLGDIEIVRMLLAAGADVHARNSFRDTPLLLASYNDPEKIRMLLAAGADVRVRNNAGWTPLHRAVSYGSAIWGEPVLSIELLLAAGADINAQDNDGQTPLHEAVSINDLAAVVTLLEAGADPNTQAEDGRTPLHMLYYTIVTSDGPLPPDPNIERALIEAGADPNIGDHECLTPECEVRKT